MLLNIMMLFLLLGLQFMGTKYLIGPKTFAVCRQIISALCLNFSMLRLNPLSNEKFRESHHETILSQVNHFPFPEFFLVMSFSCLLLIEYGLTFKEPPPTHNLIEMDTIKTLLHMKKQSSVTSNQGQSKHERDKIKTILGIVKAIYSGLIIATLNEFDLLMMGGAFVCINVLRLEDESTIDKIVQLSSGIAGFFIGSILLSYGAVFLCISIVAGYLIYYSTVLIIIHDYDTDSQFKTLKFLTFLAVSILTFTVFLV